MGSAIPFTTTVATSAASRELPYLVLLLCCLCVSGVVALSSFDGAICVGFAVSAFGKGYCLHRSAYLGRGYALNSHCTACP